MPTLRAVPAEAQTKIPRFARDDKAFVVTILLSGIALFAK
jgi:hypothetical protein